MNSPAPSNRTMCFLSMATLAWLIMIHVFAFSIFGVTLFALCIIGAGFLATLGGTIGYIIWDFRLAKTKKTPEHSKSLPVTNDRLALNHLHQLSRFQVNR